MHRQHNGGLKGGGQAGRQAGWRACTSFCSASQLLYAQTVHQPSPVPMHVASVRAGGPPPWRCQPHTCMCPDAGNSCAHPAHVSGIFNLGCVRRPCRLFYRCSAAGEKPAPTICQPGRAAADAGSHIDCQWPRVALICLAAHSCPCAALASPGVRKKEVIRPWAWIGRPAGRAGRRARPCQLPGAGGCGRQAAAVTPPPSGVIHCPRGACASVSCHIPPPLQAQPGMSVRQADRHY